ncbi:transmembrane protein 182 [Gadus morhua]|uniref:Transmembrane protein 182 n=1 Tax=Gadus morhua TaxID=8049 RepID=A0A8C5BXX6_GADMO|nr:transmembrane protein 182-like [Gadus morhua]XP_059896145.1 transmembrane protein 182 [Gadus macrocephalus]
MKLSVALFFAGIFGALATLCVLLSFGTDYWLLASEQCLPVPTASFGPGEVAIEQGDLVFDGGAKGDSTTYYHEGFFWKCDCVEQGADDTHLMWKLWLTNQPQSKICVHAYLFPFPMDQGAHNATSYDSAIIYRGFWSVFMLIGVVSVVVGGFVIICAAPFASHQLYKAGGGLFLVSGVFLLCVVVMYVLWVQVLDVVDPYVDYQRSNLCPGFELSLHYGPSFMLAPVGIAFALLSGLLFLLIGRSIKIRSR